MHRTWIPIAAQFFRGPDQTLAYPNGKLQTYTGPDGSKALVYDARGLVQTVTVTPGSSVEHWSFAADTQTPAPLPRGSSLHGTTLQPSMESIARGARSRIQERGIPPSAVGNALDNGISSPGNEPGTTVYSDPDNQIGVVTNSETERVITVM